MQGGPARIPPFTKINIQHETTQKHYHSPTKNTLVFLCSEQNHTFFVFIIPFLFTTHKKVTNNQPPSDIAHYVYCVYGYLTTCTRSRELQFYAKKKILSMGKNALLGYQTEASPYSNLKPRTVGVIMTDDKNSFRAPGERRCHK